MKPFTHALKACALAVALAGAAPTLVLAATPADQLILSMSMNNLLSLDPAAATGLEVAEINANVYDMLVELDPKNPSVLLPALAESWTVGDGGRTLTFKLRGDVKFHSGNPLTAEDVAWSLQRVLKLNLALSSTWKAYGLNAQNAEKYLRAPDARTFVLELPEPTDPKLVLYTLGASPSAFVLDRKKVMENEKNGDMGSAWLTTRSAGSGAFKLDEWRAKDVLMMSRFDGYWRGAAKLRRIVMRHLTESQSMRLMIERGDIDMASGVSAPDVEALRNDKDVRIAQVQRGNIYYVGLSVKDPKFADRRVRQAVRSLVDFDGINKTIMPHYGVYHQQPVQKGLPATLPNPGYKLDVAAARKLLSEAGYPNGFKTTIRVLAEAPFMNVATNLQSTLAQGGIEATIISGTGNQVYGAMRERNFEILVGRGGGGSEPHPHSSLRSIAYNPDNRDEAKLTNFQGWRTSFFSKELNQLIELSLIHI